MYSICLMLSSFLESVKELTGLKALVYSVCMSEYIPPELQPYLPKRPYPFRHHFLYDPRRELLGWW